MNGTSLIALNSTGRLHGKVAIITGGASGFGEATARLFVQQGAKVVIADLQDEKAISLCKDIISSSQNQQKNNIPEELIISYVHCDISDETAVKNLVDQTISMHGHLDIMFNNAGIPGKVEPNIVDSTTENFNKVLNVNVFGGYLGAKHAARVMIPRKSGVILFSASVASLVAGESPHPYAVSKHAIVGLMKNLCVEMGQYGIRVNAISPCGVSTPLLSNALGVSKEVVDGLLSESAVLKGPTPDAVDVANAAVFLASDEARFVSGVNFVVDGGYSVTNPSFSMAVKKLFG